MCNKSDGFNLNDQPKFRAGGIAAGRPRPGRAGRERAAADGTEAIEAIVARMKGLVACIR